MEGHDLPQNFKQFGHHVASGLSWNDNPVWKDAPLPQIKGKRPRNFAVVSKSANLRLANGARNSHGDRIVDEEPDTLSQLPGLNEIHDNRKHTSPSPFFCGLSVLRLLT